MAVDPILFYLRVDWLIVGQGVAFVVERDSLSCKGFLAHKVDSCAYAGFYAKSWSFLILTKYLYVSLHYCF